VDYNEAIMRVHARKGSLLEYNGVYLAEGPWPAKAYFDACRRARARDASLYLDYGFTLPKVVSRGPYEQHAGQGPVMIDGEMEPGPPTGTTSPEVIPAPEPEPLAPKPAAEPQAGGPAGQEPSAGGAWTAAKQVAAPAARKAYDLGSLDLGGLAGKGTGERAEAAGRWSAVKPASHEAPVAATPPAGGRRSTTTSSSLKWLDPTRCAAAHEPLANSPAAEADRPAPGWKGLER
jgi:pyruvate/2-oxoglutarate dehydrogenase complex dihydrolipoamide acyltransferase (E2) component